MESNFVTYEQAVALKELGFNEECFGAFIGKELRIKIFVFSNDLVGYANNNLITGAPLKSQVFRWFREKYNQNSFIELVYQDGIKYDYALYVDKDEEECENFGDGPFNTYEEAENVCIDKLIEIVKQQK
jgi:hypothetical protein